MIRVGSDFSGVGAFDVALKRLGIEYHNVFACDMDKYARITYIANHGEPDYFPWDVYDREIPAEPLDIYMTSPPCQAFSLAGQRKGETDDRGVLFYNSHEFIKQNKPRYFIFENVKGLLSMDNGRVFGKWCELLGGKSINGVGVLFPADDSVPYHIYHTVLNAKDYGVPQNRERVFIVGIRDDKDNEFGWPKPMRLEKRLKDVLEENVDEKYFLSEKMLTYLQRGDNRAIGFIDLEKKSVVNCLTAGYHKTPTDGKYLKIKSATSKGYEIATENDSINFSQPNSETRRGRVGRGVAQTITTQSEQGIIVQATLSGGKWDKTFEQSRRVYSEEGISPTIPTMGCGNQEIKIGAFRGRNPNNPNDRTTGAPTEQRLEINENGISNTITTVQKDNVVVNDYRIRRLTPRECFRLMDFPDTFDISQVSDTQVYKQAGNSIVVAVLAGIIKKLKL